MRIGASFLISFTLLVCLSLARNVTTAIPSHASGAVEPTKSLADEMLQPADFFQDFPEIKWNMSWAETKKAIERKGINPVSFKNAQTELAWDGKFNGMDGRGTVLFKENGQMYEIAVIIYAFDKRKEVFEQLRMKI
ncbi:MAG: hypothetical protein ACK419_07440, partial [Pyrinomonadaceae bacterium]